MALRLREVDLDGDRGELLELLRRNLPAIDHFARFAWLYLENPAGRAKAWFICDAEGRAVGTASVFPRRVWIRGGAEICGQVGNFAVDAQYRALGPAIQLQKATFAPVDAGEMAFVYDCPPHEKGMAPFLRLGMRANTRTQRLVRLLRTESALSRSLHSQSLGRLFAIGGDALLAWRQSARQVSKTHISELVDDFGAECSELDSLVRDSMSIRAARLPEILNWRYRSDPLHKYRILTAKANGATVGFVVIRSGDAPVVVDLFTADLAGIGRDLISAACSLVASAQTLRVYVSDSASGLLDGFQHAYFRYRAPGPAVVAYARDSKVLQGGNCTWQFLTADVED